MTDASSISQAQGLVDGLNLGSLLSLEVHFLWGYLAMALGLAVCLAGYYAYRFMVAVASAIAGGAVVYLLAPTVSLEGTALLTTAIGAVLVLLVVGWLLYGLAVFVLGGAAGLAVGVLIWMVGAGRLNAVSDLTNLTIATSDLPAVLATALLPAIGLGVLAYQWERRLVTAFVILLGGLVFAFGLRYSGLPDGVRHWGPVLAGIAIAVGLYLNSTGALSRGSAGGGERKQETAPQQRRAATGGAAPRRRAATAAPRAARSR